MISFYWSSLSAKHLSLQKPAEDSRPSGIRAKAFLRTAARATAILIAASTALTSCTPGSDLPPLADTGSNVYSLGPGDKLRIITFGSDQLTGEFQINDAGKLSLPLLGSIPAAGETTDQLQQGIARELQEKNLFRDPNVSVEVSTYRPIFILGEVNKPGSYPYQPGMTVLSAVSTAGGFTYRAATEFASIVRAKDGTPVEGKVNRQSYVAPGDVITVFERRF